MIQPLYAKQYVIPICIFHFTMLLHWLKTPLVSYAFCSVLRNTRDKHRVDYYVRVKSVVCFICD